MSRETQSLNEPFSSKAFEKKLFLRTPLAEMVFSKALVTLSAEELGQKAHTGLHVDSSNCRLKARHSSTPWSPTSVRQQNVPPR